MKRNMRKVVAFIVSVALIVCLIQIPDIKANAATAKAGQLVEVIKDNAPLRVGPTNKDEIVARTYQGRVLVVKNALINSKGNLWYEVCWEDEIGDGKALYIYSGNAEAHKYHYYHEEQIADIYFKYCNCGKVYIDDTSKVSSNTIQNDFDIVPAAYSGVKNAKYVSTQNSSLNEPHVEYMMAATMTPAFSATGALSLADGPLPFGEIVGAIIVVGAWAWCYTNSVPDTVVEVATDVDAIEWIKNHTDTCTATNYRMVVREGKKLKRINDECIPAPMAYIYTRYIGGDVWTPDATGTAALEVVSLSDVGYFGPEVDKNKTGYYYHYHYGTDHDSKRGGHVFFGTGVGNNCIPE